MSCISTKRGSERKGAARPISHPLSDHFKQVVLALDGAESYDEAPRHANQLIGLLPGAAEPKCAQARTLIGFKQMEEPVGLLLQAHKTIVPEGRGGRGQELLEKIPAGLLQIKQRTPSIDVKFAGLGIEGEIGGDQKEGLGGLQKTKKQIHRTGGITDKSDKEEHGKVIKT